MIKEIRIQFNSMKRSKQFCVENPLVPANALVTATVTALGTSISTMEALAGGRVDGTGTFHGASQERKFAKLELRDALSALSAVSKTLDKAVHPDVAEQLKMRNHSSTYVGLLAFASAAVAIVEPMKQIFIDHGAAASVVEDIEARIAALEVASNRKFNGLASQVGKGAALIAQARIGMAHVRKLDGILSQLYKNNVELYTAWKAAKRQQQALDDEEEQAPTPPTGS
jgi:hypothetical protein